MPSMSTIVLGNNLPANARTGRGAVSLRKTAQRGNADLRISHALYPDSSKNLKSFLILTESIRSEVHIVAGHSLIEGDAWDT